jgi:peptide/nickel transport system permease protein
MGGALTRVLRRAAAGGAGVVVCAFLLAAAAGDPAPDAGSREAGAGSAEKAAAARLVLPTHLPLFFNADPEDAPRFCVRRLGAVEAAAERAGARLAAAAGGGPAAELSASSFVHQLAARALDGRLSSPEALVGAPTALREALGAARAEFSAVAEDARRLVRRGALTVRDAGSEPSGSYALTARRLVLARAAERAALAPSLDVPAELLAALAADAAALAAALDRLGRLGDVPAATIDAAADPAARAAALRRHAARALRREGALYRVFDGAADRAVARLTETRFAAWLGDLARLDLGASLGVRPGADVAALLVARLPATLCVVLPSFLLLFLLGVPLGLRAAAAPGGRLDRALLGGLGVLHACPEFWTGTALVLWLVRAGGPVAGLRSTAVAESLAAGASPWSFAALTDLGAHLVAPAVVLTLPGLLVVVRHVRAAACDAAASPWYAALVLRGADAAELRARLRRHLVAPTAALAGASLPALVGGSLVVESLFDVPGVARLLAEAALLRDAPVALGATLLAGGAAILGRAGAELAQAAFDPRVEESAS